VRGERGQAFARFLQNLPPEQRAKRTAHDRHLAEAEHARFQASSFLRWVANEEALARNIIDLRDEGTGKLVELTIRYRQLEWSFSCGESDYLGHSSASEDSRRPHYHLQMRVNRGAFIRYNDFHPPAQRP
jgi:hypothetical protein